MRPGAPSAVRVILCPDLPEDLGVCASRRSIFESAGAKSLDGCAGSQVGIALPPEFIPPYGSAARRIPPVAQSGGENVRSEVGGDEVVGGLAGHLPGGAGLLGLEGFHHGLGGQYFHGHVADGGGVHSRDAAQRRLGLVAVGEEDCVAVNGRRLQGQRHPLAGDGDVLHRRPLPVDADDVGVRRGGVAFVQGLVIVRVDEVALGGGGGQPWGGSSLGVRVVGRPGEEQADDQGRQQQGHGPPAH